LPETEIDMPEWQIAMEALLLVSRSGPPMLARIAVMKALNRHVERVFNPNRKDHHGGKRKLKRDQGQSRCVSFSQDGERLSVKAAAKNR
jgi:hypothetical protein